MKCILNIFALAVLPLTAAYAGPVIYTPVKWTNFVQVAGQPLPVPEQWLQDAEARIAHGLKLPESVPKPVPFDFAAAEKTAVKKGNPRVAVQYFNHLCDTDAGEWIFRTATQVEGLYFARPQGMPASGLLTDPYGPEAPWVQRLFELIGDSVRDQGGMFVSPPHRMFRFVEQPRRYLDWIKQPIAWQAHIEEPYLRLFGYTREHALNPDGSPSPYFKDKTPMQVIGIPQPTARYAYTWRGLRRERDREHGIAGGELIIYDRTTQEILAVRRNFLITGKNPRGTEKAVWAVGAPCAKLPGMMTIEIEQFAFDTLQTIEPSVLFRKK